MKILIYLLHLSLAFEVSTSERSDESCPTDGCPSSKADNNFQNLDQEDDRLIEKIRKEYLVPPPRPIR